MPIALKSGFRAFASRYVLKDDDKAIRSTARHDR
jgi:hypothetical protein